MSHKEMIYLKGIAKGNHLYNTLKAITAATFLHEGQYRNSGEPYIDHPMRVTSALVALNIRDDVILSTSMLHDVLEDCDVTPEELVARYGIHSEIIDNVKVLSKCGITTDVYYENIKRNPVALLVKIADRCHNVSTMVGSFSTEKMKMYVQETEEYIMPLCKHGKRYYPEYSDQIFSMKYHIESICKAVKGFIEILETPSPECS